MLSVKKNPIVIIGMHRSGTTLLTKILDTNNDVFWGSKLGKINNESYFFQSINKKLLRIANANWDCPEMLDYCDDFYFQQSINYINSVLSSYKIFDYWGQKAIVGENFQTTNRKWGWKDPRTSLLIDIWKNIFPQMQVIHIYRNPLDVALSLQKRQIKYEEFSKEKLGQNKNLAHSGGVSFRVKNLLEGLNLWEFYTEKALNFKGNIIHIAYENLLENPTTVLEELSVFLQVDLTLNFKLNVDSSRANAYKNQAISKDILDKFKESSTVQNLKIQF